MFTGLIESLGIVESIKSSSGGARITIKTPELASELKIGDSVSTNGVCLTVVVKTREGFSADVMPVTLSNTNLGKLSSGSIVNLERAMKASDRFDGHMVTGHIDAVGVITNIKKDGNATLYRLEITKKVVARMIDRGSIAVDGISLTIQKLFENGVEVSIIPHTSQVTTLAKAKAGDWVNIESDVIGKYVERLLGAGLGVSMMAHSDIENKTDGEVSMEMLQRFGFL